MYQNLFGALERPATVITGSKHLARALREQHTAWQRDRGRSVWNSPEIIDWGGFLDRLWRERMLQGGVDGTLLLNRTQEAALWESIIASSPAGRTLLRIPETAQAAVEAWKLIHAYRVPFRPADFSASDDSDAFYKWAGEFRKLTDANQWLEPARLPDFLLPDLHKPESVIIAGLDDPTPQQRAFLDGLGADQRPHKARAIAPAVKAGYRDATDEVRAAAQWARGILEKNATAQIGIIVPNLESIRPRVERIFGEYLQSAFHISLGAPLQQHPIVHAALLIVECMARPVPLERAGLFLRSPFLKGAGDQASKRAQMDAKLRHEKAETVHVPSVTKLEPPKFASEQTASAWARTFSRMLKVAGWPGDQTLTSAEYQAVHAWNALLSNFATLDAVSSRMTLQAALDRLRHLAGTTDFQPESTGAPVQIAGLLEVSGLTFDHVWVMGLHDQAMPPRAKPHPFIPIALQREYGLPHCSAERELEFNTKLIARLAASAPDVILSYPESEGDQALWPSPLLPARTIAPQIANLQTWTALIYANAQHESLHGSTGQAFPPGSEKKGGTSILRDMAACPFRAFGKHRLGARGLENPQLGLDAKDKGTSVHVALRLVWQDIKTHANLLKLTETEMDEIVSRAVDASLAEFSSIGITLERLRLIRLLTRWLELERGRPPFTVMQTEEPQAAVIGGLQITTRIDRIDQLANGKFAIIDYKTGQVNKGSWWGDRLDEPQVPLYCVANGDQIAAAAFAQIRTGELRLLGVSDDGELGHMEKMKVESGVGMEDLIEQWEKALHKLGADFLAGVAAVDPKQRASCDYCELPALCRIHDNHD
jgi:probable DNA repair protein